MTNILNAIYNIIRDKKHIIGKSISFKNRANNMGDALEKYMKDTFANTLTVSDEKERNYAYSQLFSWLGNQNNPPDFIIKSGDAVEVKKIESIGSDLALNSSYPKSQLYATSPMIANGCRDCEIWDIKDIIYAVGYIKSDQLKSLWMVYGNIYAAEQDIYERIKTTISSGINSIPGVEFSETKELGRVNRVDPLGITNLRIRGMWSIQNPRKVFEYIYPKTNEHTFELVCIIPKSKYYSFDSNDIARLESIKEEGLIITDENVTDPNNPARLIDVKLIIYTE